MKNIIEELNNKICILNNSKNSNFINEKDYLLLEEGIGNKMNKIISQKRLIYKASKKSFRVNDFHKQCDGKSNTVTFILTNKGKKFGAFADQEWDSFSSLKKAIMDLFFLWMIKKFIIISLVIIFFVIVHMGLVLEKASLFMIIIVK